MAPGGKEKVGGKEKAGSVKDDHEEPGMSASGTSTLIDIGQLASILTQARGPIIDRLGRALPKFSGDGTIDVSEWLDSFERRCKTEQVGPEEVIDFLLEGNAARVFRAMRVSEASQWDVVKGVLLSQYGMPRQEAFRRFTARQLLAGEAVDVYVDDLQRFGARMEVTTTSMFFRVKFLEGLTPPLHKWAVMLPEAYTCEFDALLTKVRDRLSAQRAATGQSGTGQATGVAAASKKQGLVCPRCQGPHRVRDCTQKRRSKGAQTGRPSSRSRSSCFSCGKPGHFSRDCPDSRQTVASSAGDAGFSEEAVERGTATSPGETMED